MPLQDLGSLSAVEMAMMPARSKAEVAVAVEATGLYNLEGEVELGVRYL